MAAQAWASQSKLRGMLDAQRVLGTVASAMRNGHETLSAFLAPDTGTVQHWQQLFLVCTALMGAQGTSAAPP